MAEPLLLTTSLLPPMVITQTGPCSYTVRCGDRYATQLDGGEALWTVAAYLNKTVAGYLRTDPEDAAFWESLGMEVPARESL